jgi:hypothetical protein
VSGINDPGTCGGAPLPCSVNVQGTLLEQPPAQPANIGGGLNSTLAVDLQTPLASGDSLNVNFRLGIQRTGYFRFLVIVETLP